MSGLQNIIAYINSESEQQINGILAEARARIDYLKEESMERADRECSRIDQKAKEESATLIERGRASAELRKKQSILASKQELISQIVEECKARLSDMEEEQYFSLLAKLLEKHMPESDAVLFFNKRDLMRMPDAFRKKAEELTEGKGIRAEISDSPADIGGGFIISFGDVEENLSIEALIEEDEGEIRDICGRELFS